MNTGMFLIKNLCNEKPYLFVYFSRMQNHSWPWQTQCQAGKRLDVMRLGWCKWIDGEYYDEEEE